MFFSQTFPCLLRRKRTGPYALSNLRSIVYDPTTPTYSFLIPVHRPYRAIPLHLLRHPHRPFQDDESGNTGRSPLQRQQVQLRRHGELGLELQVLLNCKASLKVCATNQKATHEPVRHNYHSSGTHLPFDVSEQAVTAIVSKETRMR